MKRSAINRSIAEAMVFFQRNRFMLPPFAHWSQAEWNFYGTSGDELKAQRLGWDVTDFNHGRFHELGLTLFTLRNAGCLKGVVEKPYAEKIMFVRENQVTPYHFHAKKVEDIINRGSEETGLLLLNLYASREDGGFGDAEVSVFCDAVEQRISPGGSILLGPGQSITLPPRLYHTFRAVGGDALIGEISSENNDDSDNYFYDRLPRYPAIEEDEAPLRMLCTDY